MRTLLLDNTFFPVKVISWQRAMILMLTDRAEVVDEYESVAIRSVSRNFKLPRVLRLFSRHRTQFRVRFTRHNVFIRDNFQCQYCTLPQSPCDLTFDHVFPRSRGGETSWENVVTACRPCNTKKSNQTPLEANMRLLKKAKAPRWSAFLCLRIKENDPDEWKQWFPQSVAV